MSSEYMWLSFSIQIKKTASVLNTKYVFVIRQTEKNLFVGLDKKDKEIELSINLHKTVQLGLDFHLIQ